MTGFQVDVVESLSLLPPGGSPRELFEATWSQLGVDAEHWHRSVQLDCDGGLFVKGMYVRLVPNPQHFLRRWHVQREFRNLVAWRRSGLEIPTALAWGCERRFGIPVRSFLVQRVIRDGVDFARYVRGATDSAQRLAMFRAVGEAVGALHRAGWIHGDLACRNLMVRQDGGVVFVDLARVKPTDPDRLDWRRRKELYRLVKSADKCGASDDEVRAMLDAAAGDDAGAVIDATRSLRAYDRRYARKWRTWCWRVTGAVPRRP